MPLNTVVEPVKCIPAKFGLSITCGPIFDPEPGMKLITPSGNPAS